MDGGGWVADESPRRRTHKIDPLYNTHALPYATLNVSLRPRGGWVVDGWWTKRVGGGRAGVGVWAAVDGWWMGGGSVAASPNPQN